MKKISYLILFISFLIFVPKLRAYVNENSVIGYRYTDDFVVENNEESFFGVDGSLEKVRNALINNNTNMNNANFLVGFTNDDIIVVIDYNINAEFYFYSQVNPTFNRINVNTKTRFGTTSSSNSKYYYKLSDFSGGVSSLISCVINGCTNRYLMSSIIDYQLHNSLDTDLTYVSYNWFGYNNVYFIPYYATSTILNKCMGSICSSDTSGSTPFNIFGVTDYVPAYYNILGYDRPNYDSIARVNLMYKNSFIIDSSHLGDTWSLSYNFKYINNYSTIKNINVYGLVNEDNLYHYELINSKVNINSYDWSCNNGVCTFNINYNNISFNNISSYERIYFDIIYNEPIKFMKGTFNFTRNNAYIYSVIVNDVCETCLYLQLDSSTYNSFVFSSSSDISDLSFIFYSDLIENDIAYSNASFIDFNTKQMVQVNDLNKANYYYGNFNRINYSNYRFGGDIGVMVNIYSYNFNRVNIQTGSLVGSSGNTGVSGSFQLLFYITPNVSWSNSVYSYDRNVVSYCYSDNGMSICDNVEANFDNEYNSYNQLDKAIEEFKRKFNLDKLGISEVFTTPFRIILDAVENGVTCQVVTFPIPFTNKTITLPCMTAIYNQYIPDIIYIWHLVLYFVVGLGVSIAYIKFMVVTLDPSESVIKGVDKHLL